MSPGDGSDGKQPANQTTSRRWFLAAIGAGSVGLAGCSSDGSSTESPSTTATHSPSSTATDGSVTATTTATGTASDTPTPESLGAVSEPVFDLTPHQTAPEHWDLSPYATNVSARGYPIAPTLAPFGANAADPHLEYRPLLMAENAVVDDGTTWRNTLAEGFHWHDGDPVTVEDRFARAKYDNLRRRKTGKDYAFERVERVDDRTVELTLETPRAPAMFLAEHRPWVTHKASVFEPSLEAMEDATSKRAAFQVHQDLERQSMGIEDWVGHGLFEVSEVRADEVRYEQFEDFPERFRGAQNVETVRVPILPSGTHNDQFIVDEITDWHPHNVLPLDVEGSMPDSYRTFQQPSTKQYVLRLNHTNPHLARRRVRRAVAYLMQWGLNIRGHVSHYYDPIQDGTTPLVGRRWVPDYDELTADYTRYGKLSDGEQAAAELRQAGYEQNGDGQWIGPEGNVLSLELVANHLYDFPDPVGRWLSGFGIDYEYEESGDYNDHWESYEADWDLIYGFHSRGPRKRGGNHPGFSYENATRWGLKMFDVEDDGRRVPVGNRRLEYELPTEVGATDLSGETQTVNVPDLQTTVTDPTASPEEIAEATRTLSWWWNFWVPDVCTFGWNDQFVGDDENFAWRDWTDDGEADARNAYELAYGLNTGFVRGVEE